MLQKIRELPGKLTLRESTKKYILAAACIIFFLLYLSLCFNDNVWTDEAFTIELIKGSFSEIIEGTAADVHPPLYYLILKPFTMVFGSSLQVMKLVSILPMILTMALGSTVLYRREGFGPALFFILFLGAIPCTMEYAVQVRMYSWAMFFVTMMSFLALECFGINRDRSAINPDGPAVNLSDRAESQGGFEDSAVSRPAIIGSPLMVAALLGIFGAFCALTHYFAFVAALWIYGILFLALIIGKRRANLKFWLISCIVSLALFLPWYPAMRIQVMGVSKSYWIETITEKTVAEFMPFLFGMDIPMAEWIWAIVLIAALIILFIRRDIFAILCGLVPILVLLTGVTISSLMRPIFIIRYLLPCMGLVAAFLAIALGKIRDRIFMAALVLFCVCSVAVNMGVSIYREYTWTKTAQTKAFLQENVGERDIIAYNYESYKFIYDYYWDDNEKVLWMDIDLDTCPYENIWLLDTIYMPWPTDEYLAGFGWAKEYCGNYGIEHNDFKIWRLHRVK